MYTVKKIIVIGASAGGYKAMGELVAAISADLDVAVFAVLHMSANSSGEIVQHHLQQKTTLKCRVATDAQLIESGHLYLAPPDHHMMIKDGSLRVHNGP